MGELQSAAENIAAVAYAYTDTNTDTDPYANADTNTNTDADSYANADTDSRLHFYTRILGYTRQRRLRDCFWHESMAGRFACLGQ